MKATEPPSRPMSGRTTLSRQDALEKGLDKYFTGAPCRKGHAAERYAKNGRCTACRANIRKRWADGHPDQFKSIRADWVKRNPDKFRAMRRAQDIRRAQGDKRKAAWRNKDAKRKAAPGKHTAEEIGQIIKLQRGKCGYCRKKLSSKNTHIDHVMPLALGGSNYANNLQALCAHCNQTKHAKHPVEFARQMGRLI